jgi:mRNA interferase MazF
MGTLSPVRGDVFKVRLDGSIADGTVQFGDRPGIIVQIDDLLTSTVVIVPTTTSGLARKRRLPTCVFLSGADSGLLEDSVALCHQVRAIDRKALVKFLAPLPLRYMQEIERVLREILGL